MNEFTDFSKDPLSEQKRLRKNGPDNEITDFAISRLFVIPEDNKELLIENATSILLMFKDNNLPPKFYPELVNYIPFLDPSVLEDERGTAIITIMFSSLIKNEIVCNLLVRNNIHEALFLFTPNETTFITWQSLLIYNIEPEHTFNGHANDEFADTYNVVFKFLVENNFIEILAQALRETDPSSASFTTIGSALQAFGYYSNNNEGFNLCKPIIEMLVQIVIETQDCEIKRKVFSIIYTFPYHSHEARMFLLSNSDFMSAIVCPPNDPDFCNQTCTFISTLLKDEREIDAGLIEHIFTLAKTFIETNEETFIKAASRIFSGMFLVKGIIEMCNEHGIIDALIQILDEGISFNSKRDVLETLCNFSNVATAENIGILLERDIVNIIFSNLDNFYTCIGREMINGLWNIACIAQETENEELTESIFQSEKMDFIHEKYDEIRRRYDLADLPDDSIEISIVSLVIKDPEFDEIHES